MNLGSDQLLKLAKWKSVKENWISFEDDDRPIANYECLDRDLKNIKCYKVIESDGWQYSDTYFDYFFYTSCESDKIGMTIHGVHVSLNRFAPIGIYCKGSITFHESGKGMSRPKYENLYQIPESKFHSLEIEIINNFKKNNIYMPSLRELGQTIPFKLPELFASEANLGKSIIFDIIINDLY